MADLPTFQTVHEKFEAISKGVRVQRGVSWYCNPTMDESLPEGNFVLIQIPDDQYNKKSSDGGPSPFELQGYIKYVPQAKVEAPVEAKRVEKPETKK
jgi:hypothetical protein